MRTVIVGFSTRNMVGSRLIRWLDRSKFSHVLIKWHSDSYNRDIIYQASGTAVNFMGLNVFINDEKSTIVDEIPLDISDEQFKNCMQFCIDNAGKPFAFKQILGMGYVRIMRLLGKKVTNPWRDGKSAYVCSELIGTLLKNELQIDLGLDLELDGPQDLYNKLKAYLNG